jgi:hypothetical protein
VKVLVACEFSAVVRDAFRARGHDAWSADLLPTEGDPRWHFQINGDITLEGVISSFPWDMVIAHPPCTRLCNSGVRWLHERDLWNDMREAADFFRSFLELDRVPMVAVENPVMHRYAAEIVGRPATQFIQPYDFGHLESKRTGLWLKGLPPLVPTSDLKAEVAALPKTVTHKVHHTSPGADRWRERSRTYSGIAAAMAQQWGGLA